MQTNNNNQNQQNNQNKQTLLNDERTGLKNDKINKQLKTIQYQSTKTILSIQEDQNNMQKYQILKKETFERFNRSIGPCSLIELLKALICDVEYAFYNNKASGQQKQQVVYQSALEYLFQIEGIDYDTYTKNNLLLQIDELFRVYKKDLLKMCIQNHNGLEMPKKQACMRQ